MQAAFASQCFSNAGWVWQAFGEGFRSAGWLAGPIQENMCVISAVSVVSHAAVAAGVRFGVGVSVIVMASPPNGSNL
jgi:hypothetical protein